VLVGLLGQTSRDYRISLRSVITGVSVPAIPSWLLEPPWDQFAALLPGRPVYDPSHSPAATSPVDRGKLGMKRSLMVEGKGIPLGRLLAQANRSPTYPRGL
jgi:hypothetical protein